MRRRPLMVDTGAFVARYHEGDPRREAVLGYLRVQDEQPSHGPWITVEPVVGETYTLLRREAGLERAREFLHHLGAGRPLVVHVPWGDVAAFAAQQPASRLGKGVSFTDLALAVAARRHRATHVLTVNGRDFRPFGLTPVP